jgi:hypothetical protein
METKAIELSKLADISTMPELASYALGRINELIPEYNEIEDNNHFKDYLGGLIAAFENILITIGFPASELPEYEAIL